MFGLGKKKPGTKKPRRGQNAPKRAPLRYRGPLQLVTYTRNTLTDVRDVGWLAYPLIAFVAWQTYQSERRRQAKTHAATDRAASRRLARQTLLAEKPKKRFFFW